MVGHGSNTITKRQTRVNDSADEMMTTIPLPKNANLRTPAILQNALDFAYGNARMENPFVTREMINASIEEAFAIVATLPSAQELA